MPFDPTSGVPLGIVAGTTRCSSGSAPLYALKAGTRFGTWQALSTRAGGEVISSDAY
jgi:hypothetical protein